MLGKTDKRVRDTQDLMKTSNIRVLVSGERERDMDGSNI